jgi:hypothetical protein
MKCGEKMKKILALIVLVVMMIPPIMATMQTDYPNAIARYTAFGINIPTETQFKSYLLGQDNWKDAMNPGISFRTRLVNPGTPLYPPGTSATKFDLWQVMAMLSVTRTYTNSSDAIPIETPLYTVYSIPWNGWDGYTFSKTARNIDDAYAMYSSILNPNLYAWEKSLTASGRTKAEVLKDIQGTVKNRDNYYKGVWGQTPGGGYYSIFVMLEPDLYAYQIQAPGWAPGNRWYISDSDWLATQLFRASLPGTRTEKDIKNSVVVNAEGTALGFGKPSEYSYTVKGPGSTSAMIIQVSNDPVVRAFKVSGAAQWQIDDAGGEEIYAAFL